MPALPVIPATWLVTQHFHRGAQLHGMVCRFCVGSADVPIPTLTAIATKVAARFVADLMPFFGTDYTCDQTDVLPLDGASSTTTFVTASSGAVGAHATGLGQPNSLAAVVAWQTGLKGRSKRGRNFLCAPSSDQLVDARTQALTAAALNGLQVAGTAFLVNLAAAPAPSLNLRVLSRKLGQAQLVTAARADPVVHTQRRRYEKVARH